jgi:predicted nucleic acid-binding protein
MRTVFADTGYWVAIINPGDDLHDVAKSLSNALAPFRIITSEMFLSKVLNSFSKKGQSFRRAAVALIRDIQADPTIDSLR